MSRRAALLICSFSTHSRTNVWSARSGDQQNCAKRPIHSTYVFLRLQGMTCQLQILHHSGLQQRHDGSPWLAVRKHRSPRRPRLPLRPKALALSPRNRYVPTTSTVPPCLSHAATPRSGFVQKHAFSCEVLSAARALSAATSDLCRSRYGLSKCERRVLGVKESPLLLLA
jgi:hypothetical protein